MTDQEMMALCTWREARGEGEVGMRAVMHVIVNRVGKPGFGKTIQEVIFAHNQFTSMSVPSDPEFHLEPQDGDPQYAFCEQLARDIGSDPDPTNGALYYDNPRTATSGWFSREIVGNPAEHPQLAVIGQHTFYG